VNVQWWCSARDLPWTWAWQAYPGVWLFALAFGAAFWRLRRRGAWQLPAAVLTLWLTLDYPVGPLGAGYLAWVHSVQFLSLAMAVPPLLFLGLDRDRVIALLESRPVLYGIIRRLTQPLFAMIQFAVIMVVTHLPAVVDALMGTQVGAFALDLAWLGAGTLFWWPVLMRVPERPHFPPLVQMLYLFFGAQPHLYIAMWLLLARFPVYGTYELAPRVSSLSAASDQQVAGGIMLVAGGTFILVVITVLFFRWMSRLEASDEAHRAP
jgi:putative membrane protein